MGSGLFTLLLVVVGGGSASADDAAPAADTVPVRLLATTYGDRAAPRAQIALLRSEARYRRIWRRLELPGAPPEVSFTTSRVLVVRERTTAQASSMPALRVEGRALVATSSGPTDSTPGEDWTRGWVVELPLAAVPPAARVVRSNEPGRAPVERRLPRPRDLPGAAWLEPAPVPAPTVTLGRVPAPATGEVGWRELPDGTALWVARDDAGAVEVFETWGVLGTHGLPVPVLPTSDGSFHAQAVTGWDSAGTGWDAHGASFDGVSSAPLLRHAAALDRDEVVVGERLPPSSAHVRPWDPWRRVEPGPPLPSEERPWSALEDAPLGERTRVQGTLARDRDYGEWGLCPGSTCEGVGAHRVEPGSVERLATWRALTGVFWVTRRADAPWLVEAAAIEATVEVPEPPPRLARLDPCPLLCDGDIRALQAASRRASSVEEYMAWLVRTPCYRSFRPGGVYRGFRLDGWLTYADADGRILSRMFRLSGGHEHVYVSGLGEPKEPVPSASR